MRLAFESISELNVNSKEASQRKTSSAHMAQAWAWVVWHKMRFNAFCIHNKVLVLCFAFCALASAFRVHRVKLRKLSVN
jgi:hypothetical protein